MKNNVIWLVVESESNGYLVAWVYRVNGGNNLITIIDTLKNTNARTIEFFTTRKAAETVANVWNDSHKRNGNYYYQNPEYPEF